MKTLIWLAVMITRLKSLSFVGGKEMKRVILGAIALLAAITFSIAPLVIVTHLKKEVVYDCRMLHGGWHPDAPAQVQKLCREKQNE